MPGELDRDEIQLLHEEEVTILPGFVPGGRGGACPAQPEQAGWDWDYSLL